MLIGMVGEAQSTQTPLLSGFAQWLRNYGDDAGMVFHDYSGYFTLIICFILLHYIVKLLEGKKQTSEATS
jgi:hypothetical protein